MQKSALDYDEKLAIRRKQVNKGYKVNVTDNVPSKFKFNVMRSYFENNVSANFAQSIALNCLREVKSKQKYMREVHVSADTLRNYITYLHEYNMKVFQTSQLYPHSDEFSQLLIQYVVLECQILYTRAYFSKEREIQVQNRILRLLLNIYNDYFKSKMTPRKESIEKSVKAIVDIFFKLKLNFPDADYRILENMTAVLLKKIGRYEKISALKNKDISNVKDPDLTIFSTNVITSDYGTDESSNETLIQSPVCLDDEVNMTNTQLEEYPIIEIKEEMEYHIESTSVKPNSKKFTWTICLDEDGKDEDLLFYTEEVESIRETKNKTSIQPINGNEIMPIEVRPTQLCIEPNRFAAINSIEGRPTQSCIEPNRFAAINSTEYRPTQLCIEPNRFGGINSIQESPIQPYSEPNKFDISFKSNNEVLVNSKKLINNKYGNWLKQTDEILDLNKHTDEDEKPDITTLTSQENKRDFDVYKRQTDNLRLNSIENEECDEKPIVKTIQLRELPTIIDTIILDDDDDTQDDPNVNNNGDNQVEADTTDVYSSCLPLSIKSSSEYQKADNGISTTTEIQDPTKQLNLENFCLGSEKTTDNPENYIESHKEIEGNLEEIQDNLEEIQDNSEEIVSEIEVVEETIVLQNENIEFISKTPSNSVEITLLNPKDLEKGKNDIPSKKDLKLDIIKTSDESCDQVSTRTENENKLYETDNSQIQTSNIGKQHLECDEEDLISDHDDQLPEENVSQLINEEPKKPAHLQTTIKVHYNIPIIQKIETSIKTSTDNVLKVVPDNKQNTTVTILDTNTSKTSTSVNTNDLDDTKQETVVDIINLSDDDDPDTTKVKSNDVDLNNELVTELDNLQLDKITLKLDNLHVQDNIDLVEDKASKNEVITDSQSDKFTLEVNEKDVLNEMDLEEDKVQNNVKDPNLMTQTTTSKVDKEECDLISTKNQNSFLVESQSNSNISLTQEETAANQDKTATTFVDQESNSKINVSTLTENEYLFNSNKNETVLLTEPQIIPDIQEEITLNYHAVEEHQSQCTNFQVEKSEEQLKHNNIFFQESQVLPYIREEITDDQLPLDYSTKSKVQEEATEILTTAIENDIEKIEVKQSISPGDFFHMGSTKEVLTKSVETKNYTKIATIIKESTDDVNKIENLESQIKIGSISQNKTITKENQEQSQSIQFPIPHDTDIVSDWNIHNYEVITEIPVQSNQLCSMLMLAMAAEYKRKSEETGPKIVSKSSKKETKLGKVLKPSVSPRNSRLRNKKKLSETEGIKDRRITRSSSSAFDSILKPQGFKTTLPMKNVKIHQLPEFHTLKESTDGDSNDSESNMLFIDDKNFPTTDLSIYNEDTLDESLIFHYKPKVQYKIRSGKNSVGSKRPQKTKAERKLYDGPSVSLERLNEKSMEKPDSKIINKSTDENDNSQTLINLKIDKNTSVDNYEAPFRHLSKKVHCKYQNIGKHILDGNNLQTNPVKNETNFLKPEINIIPSNSPNFNISKSEENLSPTQLKKGPNLPAKLRNKRIKSTSTEIVTTDLSNCKNTVTPTSEKLKNRLKNEINTLQTNTVLITEEARTGLSLPVSVNNILETCDPEDIPLNLRLRKDLKSPTRECSISTLNANDTDSKNTDISQSQKEVKAIKCSFSFNEEEIDELIDKYTKCDKTKSKSQVKFNECQNDTIISTENLSSVMKNSRHLKNSRSKSCASKQTNHTKEKKIRSRSLSTNNSKEFSETVSNPKRRTVQKPKMADYPVEKKLRSRSSIRDVDTNVSYLAATPKMNDDSTKNEHAEIIETSSDKIKTQSVRELSKKLTPRTPPNSEIKGVVSDKHNLKSKPQPQEIDSKNLRSKSLSIEIENISIDHIQKSKFKKSKKRRRNKNLTKFEYNKSKMLPEESTGEVENPISFSTKDENESTITDQSALESTAVLMSNIISSNVESSNEIEGVEFKTNIISETTLLKLTEEIVTSEVHISKTTDCLSLKSAKFDNSSAADEVEKNEYSAQSKINKSLDIESNVEIISTTNPEEQKSTINKNIALVQDETIKQNLEIKGEHISIISEELKECVSIEGEIMETNVDINEVTTTSSDFNASNNEGNEISAKNKESRESINELIQTNNEEDVDILVEQEPYIPLAENKNKEPHSIDLPVHNDPIELPIDNELINNSNNLQVPKLPKIMSKVVPIKDISKKKIKITTSELCKRLRNQGQKGKRRINKIKGSIESHTSIESDKDLINDVPPVFCTQNKKLEYTQMGSEISKGNGLVITDKPDISEKNSLHPAENKEDNEIFTHKKNLKANKTIKSGRQKSLKVSLTSIIEKLQSTKESTDSIEIKDTVENDKQKLSTNNKDLKQKTSEVNEIQEIIESDKEQIPQITVSSKNKEVFIQNLEVNKSEEQFLSEEIIEVVETKENESEHNEPITTESNKMIEIVENELEKTLLTQVNEIEKIVDNERHQISTQNEEVKHTEFTQISSQANNIKKQNKDKETVPSKIKEIVDNKQQIEINDQQFSLPEVNEIVENKEQNEVFLPKNTESNEIEVIVESEEQQISPLPLSTENEEVELIENKDPEHNEVFIQLKESQRIKDNQNNSLSMHLSENNQISSEPTEIAEPESNEFFSSKHTQSNKIEVIVESEEQQIDPLTFSTENKKVELIENKDPTDNEVFIQLSSEKSKIIEDNQNVSMHLTENDQLFAQISSKSTEIADLEHNEVFLPKNTELNEIEVIVESKDEQISQLTLSTENKEVELIESKDPEHHEVFIQLSSEEDKIIENNPLSINLSENEVEHKQQTSMIARSSEIKNVETIEPQISTSTENKKLENEESLSALPTKNEEQETNKLLIELDSIINDSTHKENNTKSTNEFEAVTASDTEFNKTPTILENPIIQADVLVTTDKNKINDFFNNKVSQSEIHTQSSEVSKDEKVTLLIQTGTAYNEPLKMEETGIEVLEAVKLIRLKKTDFSKDKQEVNQNNLVDFKNEESLSTVKEFKSPKSKNEVISKKMSKITSSDLIKKFKVQKRKSKRKIKSSNLTESNESISTDLNNVEAISDLEKNYEDKSSKKDLEHNDVMIHKNSQENKELIESEEQNNIELLLSTQNRKLECAQINSETNKIIDTINNERQNIPLSLSDIDEKQEDNEQKDLEANKESIESGVQYTVPMPLFTQNKETELTKIKDIVNSKRQESSLSLPDIENNCNVELSGSINKEQTELIQKDSESIQLESDIPLLLYDQNKASEYTQISSEVSNAIKREDLELVIQKDSEANTELIESELQKDVPLVVSNKNKELEHTQTSSEPNKIQEVVNTEKLEISVPDNSNNYNKKELEDNELIVQMDSKINKELIENDVPLPLFIQNEVPQDNLETYKMKEIVNTEKQEMCLPRSDIEKNYKDGLSNDIEKKKLDDNKKDLEVNKELTESEVKIDVPYPLNKDTDYTETSSDANKTKELVNTKKPEISLLVSDIKNNYNEELPNTREKKELEHSKLFIQKEVNTELIDRKIQNNVPLLLSTQNKELEYIQMSSEPSEQRELDHITDSSLSRPITEKNLPFEYKDEISTKNHLEATETIENEGQKTLHQTETDYNDSLTNIEIGHTSSIPDKGTNDQINKFLEAVTLKQSNKIERKTDEQKLNQNDILETFDLSNYDPAVIQQIGDLLKQHESKTNQEVKESYISHKSQNDVPLKKKDDLEKNQTRIKRRRMQLTEVDEPLCKNCKTNTISRDLQGHTDFRNPCTLPEFQKQLKKNFELPDNHSRENNSWNVSNAPYQKHVSDENPLVEQISTSEIIPYTVNNSGAENNYEYSDAMTLVDTTSTELDPDLLPTDINEFLRSFFTDRSPQAISIVSSRTISTRITNNPRSENKLFSPEQNKNGSFARITSKQEITFFNLNKQNDPLVNFHGMLPNDNLAMEHCYSQGSQMPGNSDAHQLKAITNGTNDHTYNTRDPVMSIGYCGDNMSLNAKEFENIILDLALSEEDESPNRTTWVSEPKVIVVANEQYTDFGELKEFEKLNTISEAIDDTLDSEPWVAKNTEISPNVQYITGNDAIDNSFITDTWAGTESLKSNQQYNDLKNEQFKTPIVQESLVTEELWPATEPLQKIEVETKDQEELLNETHEIISQDVRDSLVPDQWGEPVPMKITEVEVPFSKHENLAQHSKQESYQLGTNIETSYTKNEASLYGTILNNPSTDTLKSNENELIPDLWSDTSSTNYTNLEPWSPIKRSPVESSQNNETENMNPFNSPLPSKEPSTATNNTHKVTTSKTRNIMEPITSEVDVDTKNKGNKDKVSKIRKLLELHKKIQANEPNSQSKSRPSHTVIPSRSYSATHPTKWIRSSGKSSPIPPIKNLTVDDQLAISNEKNTKGSTDLLTSKTVKKEEVGRRSPRIYEQNNKTPSEDRQSSKLVETNDKKSNKDTTRSRTSFKNNKPKPTTYSKIANTSSFENFDSPQSSSGKPSPSTYENTPATSNIYDHIKLRRKHAPDSQSPRETRSTDKKPVKTQEGSEKTCTLDHLKLRIKIGASNADYNKSLPSSNIDYNKSSETYLNQSQSYTSSSSNYHSIDKILSRSGSSRDSSYDRNYQKDFKKSKRSSLEETNEKRKLPKRNNDHDFDMIRRQGNVNPYFRDGQTSTNTSKNQKYDYDYSSMHSAHKRSTSGDSNYNNKRRQSEFKNGTYRKTDRDASRSSQRYQNSRPTPELNRSHQEQSRLHPDSRSSYPTHSFRDREPSHVSRKSSSTSGSSSSQTHLSKEKQSKVFKDLGKLLQTQKLRKKSTNRNSSTDWCQHIEPFLQETNGPLGLNRKD